MTTIDATTRSVVPLRLGERLSKLSLPLLLIVAFLALSFSRDAFFGYSNLYSILFALSIDAIAIAGFTYVMVVGEIDLSVGAVYAFAGTLAGWLMKIAGLGMWPSIGIALMAATGIGFINGYLVARLRINSLMLTIGTMILVQGVVGILTTQLVGGTYPREFRLLAKTRIFDVNVTMIIAVIMLVVLEIAQRRTGLFRKIYLCGENPDTAAIYGIRSGAIKIGVFMVSAFAAGVAGVLTASRLTHADTQMGLGLEFTFVTAAVLGGASLYGGKGGALSSVLGLFFLALILNGLVLFDIDPLAQQFVVGFLLVGAVLLDTAFNRDWGRK
jgi:ribose/xylose/arabinose/galactoside ABC-type transport system permease subunit